MSYIRSVAYKELSARIDEIQRIVSAADKLRIGGRRNQLYKNAMLSSAVLLGFAYFESYIADITDDVCKALCSTSNSASSLPDDMRTHISISSNLKTWYEIQDPGKQRKQILKYKKSGGFSILDDAQTLSKLDVNALLNGVSYPKPDNVKKLLRRLGIAKPEDDLRARGGHSIEQKLTSIHDARAELAHTGQLPAWTIADYRDRLLGLKDYAKALDKILCSFVSSKVALANWIA